MKAVMRLSNTLQEGVRPFAQPILQNCVSALQVAVGPRLGMLRAAGVLRRPCRPVAARGRDGVDSGL
jgi:hypothetical protein